MISRVDPLSLQLAALVPNLSPLMDFVPFLSIEENLSKQLGSKATGLPILFIVCVSPQSAEVVLLAFEQPNLAIVRNKSDCCCSFPIAYLKLTRLGGARAFQFAVGSQPASFVSYPHLLSQYYSARKLS